MAGSNFIKLGQIKVQGTIGKPFFEKEIQKKFEKTDSKIAFEVNKRGGFKYAVVERKQETKDTDLRMIDSTSELTHFLVLGQRGEFQSERSPAKKNSDNNYSRQGTITVGSSRIDRRRFDCSCEPRDNNKTSRQSLPTTARPGSGESRASEPHHTQLLPTQPAIGPHSSATENCETPPAIVRACNSLHGGRRVAGAPAWARHIGHAGSKSVRESELHTRTQAHYVCAALTGIKRLADKHLTEIVRVSVQ
ncbi:hypothetical protein EGW08_002859 [Elysia chlorotica]|uniref:Uncharacterized protein n=1 Tax=Elysia chlorotica TaxID=188477 RepID=A0A3S1BQZ7_ELYCH|nr:hypothetical protein EGW08_002859 [Elysia chlorotica]